MGVIFVTNGKVTPSFGIGWEFAKIERKDYNGKKTRKKNVQKEKDGKLKMSKRRQKLKAVHQGNYLFALPKALRF